MTTVAECLANGVAGDVAIRGVLFMNKGYVYLVDNRETVDAFTRAILITDQELISALSSIPGWVGGPAYQDDVDISGAVVAVSSGSFPMTMPVVEEMLLWRKSEFDSHDLEERYLIRMRSVSTET